MVVLLLFLWTVTLRQTVFNTTSTIVVDFSWLTLHLQQNAQKFEKKFAPLNFLKRSETDADFAAIEFGRRGCVIFRTETHINNLKVKINSSQLFIAKWCSPVNLQEKYRFPCVNNLNNSLSYLIARQTLHSGQTKQNNFDSVGEERISHTLTTWKRAMFHSKDSKVIWRDDCSTLV